MTAAGALGRAASLSGFAAVAWLAMLVEIAPLAGGLGLAAGPDLLFCVVAAYAMRSRLGAPIWLVFLLGLVRDALTGGALGLGALALVLASEALRGASRRDRANRRVERWSRAVVWAAASTAMVWVGLALSFAPTPALSETALRIGLTALAYPVVALALRSMGVGFGGRVEDERRTPRPGVAR